MLADDVDAATVAFEVGYESASQFNREYSRLFGQPPIRDIRSLRSPPLRLANQSASRARCLNDGLSLLLRIPMTEVTLQKLLSKLGARNP